VSLRARVEARLAAERAQQAQAQQAQGPASEPRGAARAEQAEQANQAKPALEAAKGDEAPESAGQRRRVDRMRETRAKRPWRLTYAAPFAAAAGVAFAISMRQPPTTWQAASAEKAAAPSTEQVSLYNTAGVTGLDGILDELVSLHAHPLPPEVTQPDDVHNFDPFVGVPVEAPKLTSFGAKWVGGRILPIRDSRAVMMQYSMAGGHRVTLYVFDPRRVRQESSTLQARMVRNEPVLVGNVRGYNVATTERKGVGYALATDLDEPESMEMVAAATPDMLPLTQ
jgi:hypothetical protein